MLRSGRFMNVDANGFRWSHRRSRVWLVLPTVPELPEVETVRRGLEPIVGGAQVVASWGHSSAKFAQASEITGVEFESITRRGKYLIMGLDDGRELVVHLGMTGQLTWVPEPADPPDVYVRAWWQTNAGGRLQLRDVRRFGRIAVVDAVDADASPPWARALRRRPFTRGFLGVVEVDQPARQDGLAQPTPDRGGGQYLRRRGVLAGPSVAAASPGDQSPSKCIARRDPRGVGGSDRQRGHHPSGLPNRRWRPGRESVPPELLWPVRRALRAVRDRAHVTICRCSDHHVVSELSTKSLTQLVRGWHFGQNQIERPATDNISIDVSHRRQPSPERL
jgi:hypothetical protein